MADIPTSLDSSGGRNHTDLLSRGKFLMNGKDDMVFSFIKLYYNSKTIFLGLNKQFGTPLPPRYLDQFFLHRQERAGPCFYG